MNAFVGRWTGPGRLPRETPVVLTIGATKDPKSCGTIELPELGCSAALLDCDIREYKLYVRYTLRTPDEQLCTGIPGNSAAFNGAGGFEQYMGFAQRTGSADLPRREMANVATFNPGPLPIAKCDPHGKPTPDVSGDWVGGRNYVRGATIFQKGTCLSMSVLDAGAPAFEAHGTLVGSDLQLRWTAKSGHDTGSVILTAEKGAMFVVFSNGDHPWPKSMFVRAPPFVLGDAARLLLNATQANPTTPTGAANAHALELVLGCTQNAASSRDADTALRSRKSPKVTELCNQFNKLKRGLPQTPTPELALATTKVLMARMAVERAAGRTEVVAALAEKAKWAAGEVGNPVQSMQLMAQIVAATPGVGFAMSTLLEQGPAKEKERGDLALACLTQIGKGALGPARAACKQSDEAFAKLATSADQRLESGDAAGWQGQTVKNYEAFSERPRVDNWLQQLRALNILAAQSRSSKPQIAEFGVRVLTQLTRALYASGTLGDVGTASKALASLPTTELMSRIGSADGIRQAQMQLGYRALLDEVEGAEDAATSLALAAPQSTSLAGTALDLLSLRSGKGVDVQAEIARTSRPQSNPDFVALRDLRASVARYYFSRPEAPAGATPLSGVVQSIEALERKIASSASRPKANASGAGPSTSEAQRALGGTATFIGFQRFQPIPANGAVVGEAHYAAFVVRGQGPVRVVDLGPASALDAATEAFHVALRDRAAVDGVHEQAKALYARLLGPLHLETWRVTRLLLAPDSQLHRVPFAALDDGSGWLLKKYEIAYASSVRDLRREATAAVARTKPLSVVVFADPEKASNGYQNPLFEPTSYSDLPGAHGEAERLAQIFGESKVATYLGPAAKETTFLAQVEPTILHIATHGMSLQEQPPGAEHVRGLVLAPVATATQQRARRPALSDTLLRSFLVLSHDSTQSDGLATAYEIGTMDLLGTELVVLSACQTAEGEVANWFGVHSLQQAFRIAGARNVIASLWSVDDTATMTLMTALYRNVAKGAPYGASLRAAMQSLASEATTEHPYYWAAFLLNGTGTSKLSAAGRLP